MACTDTVAAALAWPTAAGLLACEAGRDAAGLAVEVLEQAAASRPIPAAPTAPAITYPMLMLSVRQTAWVCPRPSTPRRKPRPRQVFLPPPRIRAWPGVSALPVLGSSMPSPGTRGTEPLTIPHAAGIPLPPGERHHLDVLTSAPLSLNLTEVARHVGLSTAVRQGGWDWTVESVPPSLTQIGYGPLSAVDYGSGA
jgi:hypothetical protein